MKRKYRKNSNKTKILNDFFRNALAISILKQSLISRVSTLKSGTSSTKDSVPTYLQG